MYKPRVARVVRGRAEEVEPRDHLEVDVPRDVGGVNVPYERAHVVHKLTDFRRHNDPVVERAHVPGWGRLAVESTEAVVQRREAGQPREDHFPCLGQPGETLDVLQARADLGDDTEDG